MVDKPSCSRTNLVSFEGLQFEELVIKRSISNWMDTVTIYKKYYLPKLASFRAIQRMQADAPTVARNNVNATEQTLSRIFDNLFAARVVAYLHDYHSHADIILYGRNWGGR